MDIPKSYTYSEVQIKYWHDQWVYPVSINTVINGQQLLIAPSAVKTKTTKTIYETCDLIVDTYLKDFNWKEIKHSSNRTEIVKAIMSYHNAQRIAAHAYKVADLYDCIMMQNVPEYYGDLCVSIINNRHKNSH